MSLKSKMQPLYWGHCGKFQTEYQELYSKLVPREGDADTELGQLIRYASIIYYDIYNNGGCNLRFNVEFFNKGREYFRKYAPDLRKEAKSLGVADFSTKLRNFGVGRGSVRSRDEVVDVIVSYVHKHQPVEA